MAYNMYGQTGWTPQPQLYGYQQPMQQSYAPAIVPQRPIFVEGEMAARVFQMPENWPIGVPLYLWDSNGDYFYVKMIGQNGVPMPLKTFTYHEKAPEPSGYLSGNAPQADMSQFVTRDDLDRRFNELKDLMKNSQNGRNQSGNNSQQNRGGNV